MTLEDFQKIFVFSVTSELIKGEKTKTKKTRENNRNVASYLKACKLAMISLCNHNQELNIPTQASNNNIYKFSMGKLFFFQEKLASWFSEMHPFTPRRSSNYC